MLRRQPDRTTIFAWLRVVAIHEAYRLCAAERDAHLEDLDQGQGWDAVIAGLRGLTGGRPVAVDRGRGCRSATTLV
jgi:hypothetical protein